MKPSIEKTPIGEVVSQLKHDLNSLLGSLEALADLRPEDTEGKNSRLSLMGVAEERILKFTTDLKTFFEEYVK